MSLSLSLHPLSVHHPLSPSQRVCLCVCGWVDVNVCVLASVHTVCLCGSWCGWVFVRVFVWFLLWLGLCVRALWYLTGSVLYMLVSRASVCCLSFWNLWTWVSVLEVYFPLVFWLSGHACFCFLPVCHYCVVLRLCLCHLFIPRPIS